MDDDWAIRRGPRRLLVMDDRKVDLPVIRIEKPKSRMSDDQIRSEAEGLLILQNRLSDLLGAGLRSPISERTPPRQARAGSSSGHYESFAEEGFRGNRRPETLQGRRRLP